MHRERSSGRTDPNFWRYDSRLSDQTAGHIENPAGAGFSLADR